MNGVGRPLFFALVLLAGYLTYLVLAPFLVALTWAAIFAVLFQGMQARLSLKMGQTRAALATTLLAGVLIIGPVAMLLTALAREAPTVTDYVQETTKAAPRTIEMVWQAIRDRSPFPLPANPTELLAEGARRTMSFLAPQAGAIITDAFATVGSLLAMLFALFFMLRDSTSMGAQLRDLLPLQERDRDQLLSDTRDLVIASVGAGLAVAAAQGAVGGVAFWLLGLGAPVFWGVVLAFCSLIPVVGAALVWAPAGLWLLLSGETGRGVGMLIVGVLGISMVDNVLRPLLLSGRTQVNGLVIFFGLLGGAAAFGFIGLVIGPIILVTTGRLLGLLLRPALSIDTR